MNKKPEEFVEFRGQRVIKGWPEKLLAAQLEVTINIHGKTFNRIRYGHESDICFSSTPCHDCACIEGELHFPGCDMERCPKCGGQLISCDCENKWEGV